MKCVVSDLVSCAHGEDGAACRLNRTAMYFAVRGTSGLALLSVRSRGQMRVELLPHGLGDRRSIVVKAGESCAQRAFTRRIELAAHGIAVLQVEPAQERLQ